jgi:GNAT superfamily N-acetyltransferase
MNELSKFLVESILNEDENPIKKTVVIYVGRFQPFHKGHYGTYSHLVKKFGKDNVFIGTSDKVEKPKSPFNFKEKVKIMTTMFGIPSNKIHKVKNPYKPTEILSKFDEETTAFITVVGEKDKNRLGGKYFQPYKGDPTEGYKDRGYVYAAPSSGGGVSGTEVRNGLSVGSEEQKEDFFKGRAYGKFNKTIFKMITDKLNEGVHIPKERIEDWLINESSRLTSSGGDIDDGPNMFFPNYDVFSKINIERAAKIGWEVVNMITSKDIEDYYEHPNYPNGPVKATSFFPAGVLGTLSAANQIDIYSSGAYSQWFKHATRSASLVGYELIDKRGDTEEKDISIDGAKGDKVAQQEYEASLNEAIKLPVEIGDTILTGRFKNKKTVVKTIGKDEHGMPTINGKKVVTFRLVKEGFQAVFEEETNESVWPKSKLTTQHEKNFDDHLNYRLSKKFKGKFNVVDFDLFLNGKKLLTIDKRDTYNSVLRKVMGKLKESINEIAGTEVKCEKCNHSWEIESEDTEKYLCHSCGWDSQKQEYDFDAFDSWREKMGIDESIDERSKGKLRPADLLRRKAAMAGKRAQIARRRKRTMMRRKSIDKLKKIAYKKAYLEVYKEFMEELFPGKSKSDLTIQQAKVVHKNVLRKKKRVLKRARFKFLPQLRDAEAQKFSGETNEMSKSTLNKIEKYAEKQLSPEDIEFTKHFFDRLNDPRNGKEISDAELTGFFKRLSRYKKQFKDFLEKYQQIVVKDKRTDINIPFVKQTNQIIAKTVMRKDDFKTSNPTLAFEVAPHGYPDQEWMDNHEKEMKKLRTQLDKQQKDVYGEGIENTLSNKHKVDLDIYEYPTHLELRRIVVPHDQRGKGIGSKVMQDLIKYAQQNNKDLFTTPSSDFGGSKSRLVQFYKSFGFKDNKGSNRDFRSKESMVRLSEGILNEGGAYGHMNHPFDTEINLTFGDLKDIVNRALEGNLELTREKTDGQALAISWRDGRLVAARNKGHLKNRGENALDIKGVADKFAGRGELEKAYNFAMNDLSNAIKSLSEKQREKIFKGGACFMNLEVIYPTSVNVIPYGQALLVFHGTMEYNDEGVAIGENQEAARVLAGMIKQVNKDVQDNYTIQGPPVIQLPKNQDLSSKKGKYTSQISKLQKEFGLKDTDGVAEYHQAWWERWVDKNSPSTLDNKTKMGLVKRFAFFDKSFRLDSNTISDEKVLEWAKKHEKDNHKKIAKDNLMKFEDIFLGLGAEVLQFTSSVLTVNPDKAVRDIKKRIDKTIKDVNKSGDPKKVEKLKLELKRLMAIGGPDKIVPNEGIVFQYKGNTFKLTGTFASVNQLLGIFF